MKYSGEDIQKLNKMYKTKRCAGMKCSFCPLSTKRTEDIIDACEAFDGVDSNSEKLSDKHLEYIGNALMDIDIEATLKD